MKVSFQKRVVRSLKVISHRTCWISFDQPIHATPGQFVMIWLPGKGEKPYSIASLDPFGILVVDVGPFSHALHHLKAGEAVWIKGPLGHGFKINRGHLLLAAGGYGVAPLLGLAKQARENELCVDICIGAKSAQGLVSVQDFEGLGCGVTRVTEDGSAGGKGLVTEFVYQILLSSSIDTVYGCGPVGMLSALAEICTTHKVNYQLSWEAHMRCGLGLCGSCEVPQSLDPNLPPGWLACFDGPVFINH